MTPKVFTPEARAAIDAQHGALYDATYNAFTSGNPNADNADGPALLQYFANPNSVSLIYSSYKLRVPTHVTVNGHRLRILEPDEKLEDRKKAIGSFDLVFGGIQGWLDHREKYEGLGHNGEHLERLAVRWLEGDWNNAEFLRECKRVPGFERQLAATDILHASDEDMLHLAGYKQWKAEYAREGGNPEDMDELMRSLLSGDEAHYKIARRQFESGPQQTPAVGKTSGCLGPSAIIAVGTIVGAILYGCSGALVGAVSGWLLSLAIGAVSIAVFAWFKPPIVTQRCKRRIVDVFMAKYPEVALAAFPDLEPESVRAAVEGSVEELARRSVRRSMRDAGQNPLSKESMEAAAAVLRDESTTASKRDFWIKLIASMEAGAPRDGYS